MANPPRSIADSLGDDLGVASLVDEVLQRLEDEVVEIVVPSVEDDVYAGESANELRLPLIELTGILADGRESLLGESNSSSDGVEVEVERGNAALLSLDQVQLGALQVNFGQVLSLSDEAAGSASQLCYQRLAKTLTLTRQSRARNRPLAAPPCAKIRRRNRCASPWQPPRDRLYPCARTRLDRIV